MKHKSRQTLVAVALFVFGAGLGLANPSGGTVAGGAASIAGTGTTAVTITQTSPVAIINWQSFSLASGETTKFIQPSTTSATLNRVSMSGGESLIDGTICANGQVYIVNGNGIIIGSTGLVNANGFTASTLNISDHDFFHGHMHFTSSNSTAGVQNLGTINALGGNVYLLGTTVDNEGTINATHGTVGLAAGSDIFLSQENSTGHTVTVLPGNSTTSAEPVGSALTGLTAVNNGATGMINAASAELKAAHGNLYALAINNSGVIRATTVTHQGGHIYLSAYSGTVQNSGTLNASGTGPGANGGSVTMKSVTGTANDEGTILANGGQGGAGGNAEVDGETLDYTGSTDLTAPGGTTGTLTLDPSDLTIQSGGPNPFQTGSILTLSALQNTLATANVLLSTGAAGSPGTDEGDIVVNGALSWTSANTLTLSAAGLVFLNGDITAPNGSLVFNTNTITSGSLYEGNPAGVTSNVVVGGFTLVSGEWYQSSPELPTFVDSGAFTLEGASTFIRSAGGSGTTPSPYYIVDAFGVEGIPTFPDGTVYVLEYDTPTGLDAADVLSLNSFESETANTPSILISTDFSPSAPGSDFVSVDNPDSGNGGAVNGGGSGRKGKNLASGSSTSGMPAPNRLLTAGSGINCLFEGSVNPVQPPPFVQQQLNFVLGNSSSQQDLDHAAYGNH